MPQAGSHELRGLSWGDYDGDGDIDLLGGSTPTDKLTGCCATTAARSSPTSPPTIGLTIPGRSARQTNWVDYDNDGDLDVYSADRGGDNKLFRNDGGKFTHVFVGVGPTDPRPTVGACWLDTDNDGDLDLFLANQSGAADAMWRNDGTAFVDVARAAGHDRSAADQGRGRRRLRRRRLRQRRRSRHLRAQLRAQPAVPQQRQRHVHRRRGEALGLAVENHAVGSDWGDYDNDGDLDLSVISYVGAVGAQTPLNALFRNDGAKGFVNVLTKDSPLNRADHASQFVDYDNDGGIDLSITDGYGPEGGHFLFRNTCPTRSRGAA